jgi:hypothetical protein
VSSPEPVQAEKAVSYPQHGQSIKSVSSHSVPVPNSKVLNSFRSPTTLDASAESQNPNPGEGPVTPEHVTYAEDLSSGIQKVAEAAEALNLEPGTKERVMKSLMSAKRSAEGDVHPKQLKKGKKSSNGNVSAENIVRGKRKTPLKLVSARTTSSKKSKHSGRTKFGFQVGDGVSVRAEEFDGNKPGSYSKHQSGRHLGVIVGIWPNEKLVEVEYLDGSKFKHGFKKVQLEKPKPTALLILQVMMTESLRKGEDPMDK